MSSWPNLRKRLIWSAVLIVVCIYTIFLSPWWFFLAVVEVFIVLGLLEYFNLAEKKGLMINRNLGLFFAILLPLPVYFPGKTIILTAAILCIFIFNFHRRLKEQAMVATAVTLFGIMYVGWFFSFFPEVRSLPHGTLWIFYLILILKIGDAAAYFIGKQFGTHKYIVHISPNKSIEGAIASVVATVLFSVGSKLYLPETSVLDLIILGIVFSIIGQLGDLAESLLKRDANVKDSGNIPGLGGVLDVIDSLLLTVPIMFYYLTAIRFPEAG